MKAFEMKLVSQWDILILLTLTKHTLKVIVIE